jgi:DNA-binding transcriptional LysR family regulator
MDSARYTENLAIFVEVARSHSFSAVARRHGMTPSAITRKINLLEDFIGTRLFVRSTRALSLTEAGEALFMRAVGILDALSDMHAEIVSMSDSLQGVLRISCLPTFGKLHILPWLPQLSARYPKLRIDLDLTERIANPSIERLDAAIRIGKLKDSSLFANQLAGQRWVICASPGYLVQQARPESLQELGRHRIIDKLHDPAMICWKRLQDKGHVPPAEVAFRCDDFEGLRQAALRGLGLAFLPDWVVGSDLREGRLAHLFDDPDGKVDGIYLMRALPRMSAKLEVFYQALRAHIGTPAFWQRPAAG